MSQTHIDHLDRHAEHEQAAATAQASPTSVAPIEPQDPHAAGAATSEQHDLLHKNISGSKQKGVTEESKDLESEGHTNAGMHATGSSTGATGGQ